MFETIAEHYREGGFWMIPISCFQGVSFALMIERVYVLFFKTKLNKEAVLAGLRERIFRGDVMGAIRFLSDQPQSPLTRILKAGLLEVRHGEEEVQAAMDEASMHEIQAVLVQQARRASCFCRRFLLGRCRHVGFLMGL